MIIGNNYLFHKTNTKSHLSLGTQIKLDVSLKVEAGSELEAMMKNQQQVNVITIGGSVINSYHK